MKRKAGFLDEAEIVAKLAALPALPPLVTDLVASFQQDNLDISTLARRIGADQGLAARTLRIANSPFYGLSGRVLTIDDAIVILGFRAVRSLVLASAVLGAFAQHKPTGIDPRMFWHHSVGVAIVARVLAKQVGGNPESAFTSGLLHDIGRVTLAVCFPEPYRQVLDWQSTHGCLNQEAEQIVLGTDHVQVGLILGQQWGLPPQVLDVITHHHQPDAGETQPLVDLIHVADVLTHALELGGQHGAQVPRLDQGTWDRLALKAQTLLTVLGPIENEFEETCHVLLA